MIESLNLFFRGASGLTILVIGFGFMLEPEHVRFRFAFGSLYASVGASLLLSWSSQFGLLPLALDNLLILGFVLVGSLALFEIQLYLFGDEARRGMRLNVYRLAMLWSAVLWVLPFLDSILGLPVLFSSIEDGRAVALFQSITLSGMYALPIVTGVVSLRIGRWKLSDIPADSTYVRILFIALVFLLVVLIVINTAFAAGLRTLYHIGQMFLQVLLLGWYLYFKAVPELCTLARKEIGREHKKKTQMDPAEVAMIQEKLRLLASVDRIYTNPGLDPAKLAKALDVPVYKLNVFMTVYRGTTFVEWLHTARIDHARTMLAETPGVGIDEVAKAAGYSSLSIFRSQFQRRVGMTPEAYGSKNRSGSDRSRRKAQGRV